MKSIKEATEQALKLTSCNVVCIWTKKVLTESQITARMKPGYRPTKGYLMRHGIASRWCWKRAQKKGRAA